MLTVYLSLKFEILVLELGNNYIRLFSFCYIPSLIFLQICSTYTQ